MRARPVSTWLSICMCACVSRLSMCQLSCPDTSVVSSCASVLVRREPQCSAAAGSALGCGLLDWGERRTGIATNTRLETKCEDSSPVCTYCTDALSRDTLYRALGGQNWRYIKPWPISSFLSGSPTLAASSFPSRTGFCAVSRVVECLVSKPSGHALLAVRHRGSSRRQ